VQTGDSLHDGGLRDIAEQHEQLLGQLKRLLQLDCVPLLRLVSVVQEIHLVVLVYHTLDHWSRSLHKFLEL